METIKKLIMVILCMILALSCKSPLEEGVGGGDSDGGSGPGGGGSGGGSTIGKGYVLPTGSLSQEEQKKDYDPNVNTTTLYKLGDYGSKFFRIPALICTSNGVILAAADRRYDHPADLGKNKTKTDVLVRRSLDLGKTWSEPIVIGNVATDFASSYGDAFFINCHNGDVLCGVITEPGTQAATPRGRTIIYRSKDDGLTWTKEIEIKPDQIPLADRGWGASGQGATLRYGINAGKNRLAFAFFQFMTQGNGSQGIRLMISEDDGKSFAPAQNLPEKNSQLDETKVIELSDGSIMLNHRQSVSVGKRKWSITKDNGIAWNVQGIDPEVNDPGNNADFSRYEFNGRHIKTDKYILMINANATANGKWFFTRKNHYIRLTKNEFNNGNGIGTGKYAYSKQLVNKGENLYSGYPTITTLPDGTIATLTEETWQTTRQPIAGDAGGDDYNIVFRRFNLYWLSGGAEYVDYDTDYLFQFPNK